MDRQLKQKWIEALRSGEYQQGRYSFELNDAFCCLGVLCKVAGQPTMIDPDGSGEYADNYDFIRIVIPSVSTVSRLEAMNDGSGDEFENNRQSFAQIADYIENTL